MSAESLPRDAMGAEALAGIRVVEFAIFAAGPVVSKVLHAKEAKK